MESLSIARLYEEQKQDLDLELLSDSLASKVDVTVSDINRPGMALMGYTDGFHSERIQVVGETELGYLATLDTQGEREALRRVFGLKLAGIFIAQATAAGAPIISAVSDALDSAIALPAADSGAPAMSV